MDQKLTCRFDDSINEMVHHWSAPAKKIRGERVYCDCGKRKYTMRTKKANVGRGYRLRWLSADRTNIIHSYRLEPSIKIAKRAINLFMRFLNQKCSIDFCDIVQGKLEIIGPDSITNIDIDGTEYQIK